MYIEALLRLLLMNNLIIFILDAHVVIYEDDFNK